MVLTGYISLIILFAFFNYYIISSYGTNWVKKHKDNWHTVQFLIVCLTAFLIFGWTKELIIAGLVWYSLFEPTLNFLRFGWSKIFYVSVDGSFTDKLRTKVFGKYAQIAEGAMKAIAIGIIIWIKLK